MRGRAGIQGLALLALLGVFWLWWSVRRGPDHDLGDAGPKRAESPPIAGPSWGRESAEVARPGHAGDPSFAIDKELVVRFASEAAMERFLQAAREAGILVLGTQATLRAVRISGEVAAFSSLLEEGTELGYNYPVQVPLTPALETFETGALRGFSGGVLSFLGAEAALTARWGRGIQVAILDTGVTTHADLGERIREIDLVGGGREGPYGGHGLAVAGLIGSTNAFAPGIAPGSELIAVRVLDAHGQGDTFTLADGIVRAVDAGAQVINLSLGSYGDSEVLRDAVAYAEARGVVLVASSGNDGLGRLTYPAAYPTVLAVGAVDANGSLAPFSNFAETLDLVAPGYQVNALWENDAYVSFDGTSASAPLVTGMVARLIEGSPGALAPEAIRMTLREYANEAGPPGPDPYYGAGVLNATRLENIGEAWIMDLALADIFPAVAEANGSSFPLYVTVQNRGTQTILKPSVELMVDGTPYFYQFAELGVGDIETIQLPMSMQSLEGRLVQIEAKVSVAGRKADAYPANDSAAVQLGLPPGGD